MFSGPYFSAFGLNMEIYKVNLRIQSECGKIRTRKTPNRDPFHAVNIWGKRCCPESLLLWEPQELTFLSAFQTHCTFQYHLVWNKKSNWKLGNKIILFFESSENRHVQKIPMYVWLHWKVLSRIDVVRKPKTKNVVAR